MALKSESYITSSTNRSVKLCVTTATSGLYLQRRNSHDNMMTDIDSYTIIALGVKIALQSSKSHDHGISDSYSESEADGGPQIYEQKLLGLLTLC